MSVHEIVSDSMKIRVMQMRVDAAMAAVDFSARCFLQQVDRANRLEADLMRARRQNAELLERMARIEAERKPLLLAWA